MINHYIKIAIRNLGRQKGLTIINVFGLSIGIACFSLFLLYALNEFSYDRFHINKENIYRIYRWRNVPKGSAPEASIYSPMPLGPAMKEEIPGIKSYIRFKEAWNKSYVKVNGAVKSTEITFADPEVFSVFTFPFKYGDPKKALLDPHAIVITEKVANALFSTSNVVGKTVEIKVEEAFEPFVISGVCENPPSNSSIVFDVIGSFEYYMATDGGKRGINDWQRSAFQTYVMLEPQSTLGANFEPLKEFYSKHHPDDTASNRPGYWQNKKSNYGLQNLASIHTDIVINDSEANDPKNTWILICIASSILIIACINFTTLAIGRSAGRAKEIGIRKVVGGSKKSLVFQFLSEAILLSVMASILGFLLAQVLLPFFNNLSGEQLVFSFRQFPEIVWLLVGLTFVVGFLAGTYPALVLSAFKPLEVLKKKLKLSGSNIFTRSLVTFQFVLSIVLIISTLIILKQLRYMYSKNPGFDKENVILVDAEDIDTEKIYPLFRELLLRHPQIKQIGASEIGIGEAMGWSRSGFEYNKVHKEVYEYFVDPNFIDVMDIELIAGKNLEIKKASDTSGSIIVNETMMKDFGWTLDNAVGQVINGYSEGFSPVVVGVIKDFNFRSFREKIRPQMFHQFPDHSHRKYFVRIQNGDPSEAIAAIGKVWHQLVSDIPLTYTFLDEGLDRFYKAEVRWATIIEWAGGISVFLACLGLLGLAALASHNRIKEIGIRKILGASVLSIMQLISKDFVRLIAVAIIIASPLAWYLMSEWLMDFAYRIEIRADIFLLSGALVVVVAVVTISVQAIKAATANPVKSIRSE